MMCVFVINITPHIPSNHQDIAITETINPPILANHDQPTEKRVPCFEKRTIYIHLLRFLWNYPEITLFMVNDHDLPRKDQTYWPIFIYFYGPGIVFQRSVRKI